MIINKVVTKELENIEMLELDIVLRAEENNKVFAFIVPYSSFNIATIEDDHSNCLIEKNISNIIINSGIECLEVLDSIEYNDVKIDVSDFGIDFYVDKAMNLYVLMGQIGVNYGFDTMFPMELLSSVNKIECFDDLDITTFSKTIVEFNIDDDIVKHGV